MTVAESAGRLAGAFTGSLGVIPTLALAAGVVVLIGAWWNYG